MLLSQKFLTVILLVDYLKKALALSMMLEHSADGKIGKALSGAPVSRRWQTKFK
jgi:hypothetical protein